MTIVGNGNRYSEFKYSSEKEFEDDVVLSSSILFGKDTILTPLQKRPDSIYPIYPPQKVVTLI